MSAHDRKRTPALEWIVAALGLVLVVGVVAFLVVQATHDDGAPPILSVHVDSVVTLGDSAYLVQFTAENRGRATAAGVGIVGEVGEGAAIEQSRASVDYLPGRSTHRGGLLFRGDPRGGRARLRVEGYREP